MITFPRINLILLFFALLASCASGPRPYYSRLQGGYCQTNPGKSGIRPLIGNAERTTGGGGNGETVVQTAKRYLGTPYLYGGETRNGMDCSGLVKRVYAEALNMQLPHNSRQISQIGMPLSLQDLKPGDVVIFGSVVGINHSGIYTGRDRFIHASRKWGVRESTLSDEYWKRRWKMGRRLF